MANICAPQNGGAQKSIKYFSEGKMNNLPKDNFYINLAAEGLDLDKITSHIAGELGYKYVEVANGRAFWTSEARNLYHNSKDRTKHFIKQAEPKNENPEIVEIDGRKFRLVPEQANFKNCDLVMKDGKEYEFIGYYEADVVVRELGTGELSQHENVEFCKLEEVKTKVWHYAIYKKSPHHGSFANSYFYETEEILKRYHPDALEYRTFEEQL